MLRGFTLEIFGSEEELRRIDAAIWKEYAAIQADAERKDGRPITADRRVLLPRCSLHGTVTYLDTERFGN